MDSPPSLSAVLQLAQLLHTDILMQDAVLHSGIVYIPSLVKGLVELIHHWKFIYLYKCKILLVSRWAQSFSMIQF